MIKTYTWPFLITAFLLGWLSFGMTWWQVAIIIAIATVRFQIESTRG